MIDVIMPIYNSGKTIIRALNSILNQSNHKDLIIYLIDDNSKDSYKEIIDFFSKYLNIKYYRLSKNSGPGVARQYGLNHSNSEYIVFIDPDDEFYNSKSILNLYKAMKDNDLVIGKMRQIFNGEEQFIYHDGCLHGKMYRRSYLKSNNIKFPKIRLHEDNAFNRLNLCCSEKICYIDSIIYDYKDTENSISKSESIIKNFEIYYESMNWLFSSIQKRKRIVKNYAGIVTVEVLLYSYFSYLSNPKELKFCFDKLSLTKKMYNRYNKYVSNYDFMRIYNGLNNFAEPKITVNEFIEKIK